MIDNYFTTLHETGRKLKPSLFSYVIACLMMFLTMNVSAQVNVTSSGGTPAASYANLKGAFDAINAGTHTGVITVGIAADVTETAPAVLFGSGTGSSSYSGITISPEGGAAHKISGAIAAGSPLIDLDGADNVVIDGLNTGGNALTIENTSTSSVANTSTIRYLNDATSNTITNCTINGASTAPGNTNGGTILFGTGLVNGNDNNIISYCNLGPVSPTQLPSRAIYAAGLTNNATSNNSNIQILNNNIYDFFHASNPSNGIFISSGNTEWVISTNRFYQTATRTQLTTGNIHAVIQNASNGMNGGLIENNIIGYNSSAGTGTYSFAGIANSRFYGIYLPSMGAAIATTVTGNTITALSASGALGGQTTNSPFIGILVAGLVNVTNNTIGGSTSPTHISINSTASIATENYGIYNSGNGIVSGNFIGGITVTSATNTATQSGTFNAIYTSQGHAINNTIGYQNAPITINATVSGSTGTQLIGIKTAVGASLVTGNIIRYMNANTINATGGFTASVIGISITSTTVTNNIIRNNQIYALSNTNTSTSNHVYGICYQGIANAQTTSFVEYNQVYALTSSGSNSSSAMIGINMVIGGARVANNMITLGFTITGASANTAQYYGLNESGNLTNMPQNSTYHNSVYIGGTSSTGTANSMAYRGTTLSTSTRNTKNNIFANFRTSTGTSTGKHYACQVSGTVNPPAGLSMNGNILYSASGIVGLYNSVDRNTLTDWTNATSMDANSYSADPQYLNPTAAVPDLHINPAVMSFAESTGLLLSEVIDDYDGQIRSAFTPNDIGADALNGISPAPTFLNKTLSPSTPQCAAIDHTISVDVTNTNGTLTTVTLNYAYNGLPQTPVSMVLSGGNTYTATIPAATPTNATVTWYVVAMNDSGYQNTTFGTSYKDDYLLGHTTTITATPPAICVGDSSSLRVNSFVATPGLSTVGVQTGTSTSQQNALRPSGNQARTQMLYLASELLAAGIMPGNITSITFNVTTTTPAAGMSLSNVNIKMGNTSTTVMTPAFLTSPMTLVYTQPTLSINVGALTLTFTTPFVWDGVSNVVVDMCQSSATSLGNAIGVQSTPAASCTYNDGAGSCSQLVSINNPVANRPLLTFGGSIGTLYSPGMSWLWTPGSMTGTTNVVSPTATTAYSAIGTDINGCSVTSVATDLTVDTFPDAPTSLGSTQCGAGIPPAKMSSTTGGVNYLWYLAPTGGTPVQNSSVDSLTSYLITTTTTFYVSVLVPSQGCESPRTAVVATVNQPDSVYITASAGPYCPGVMVTLTANQTGANQTYTYTWSSSSTGAGLNTTSGTSVTASPIGAGDKVYTITANDNSCTYINTYTIALSNNPVIQSLVASPSTICNGQSTVITALSTAPRPATTQPIVNNTSTSSLGNPYRINLGSLQEVRTQILVTAAEMIAAGYAPGNITGVGFTVTGTPSGTLTNFTINLKQTTQTALNLQFETGMTTVFTASSFTPVTGLNMHTFSTPFNWDGTSGLIIETCQTNPATTGANIVTALNTTGTVNWAAALGACSVQFGSVSSTRAVPTFACLKYQNVPDDLTYLWLPGNLTDNPLTVSPSANQTYDVKATNAAGCTTVQSVNVTVDPTWPAPTAVDSIRCGFGPANVKVVSTSGQPAPVFAWYTDSVGGSAIQQGTADSLTGYNASQTTTFYVGEVYAITGCVGPRTAVLQTVTQPDSVYITATDSFLCPGETATLNAIKVGSLNNYTYSWVAAPPNGSGMSGTQMGSVTSVISTDFNAALPSNAAITGHATQINNYLRLTNNTTNQAGALTVTGAGSHVDSLYVSFDLYALQNGAEGISYSFADDGSATSTSPNFENGTGNKLAISFDALTSGSNSAGIYLMYDPVSAPATTNPIVLQYVNNTTWEGVATPKTVVITIDRDSKLSMTLNGTPIFTNVQLPNAYIQADKSTWNHWFKARTSTGSNISVYAIDNLTIKTANLTSEPVAGSSLEINPTLPGTYNFQVLAQDGGCAYAASLPIVRLAGAPAISAGSDQTICTGSNVTLTAMGPAVIPPVRITEGLTQVKAGTGSVLNLPSFINTWVSTSTGKDLIEISNLSTTAVDISGITVECWSGTAAIGSITVPSNASLVPAGGLAFFSWSATAVTDVVNNFYCSNGGVDINGGGLFGVIIRRGSLIIDAVGYNGYAFPVASGVTVSDWAGGSMPSNAGYSGTVLTGPDMNSATNWSVTAPPLFANPGQLNAGLSLNLVTTGVVSWTSSPAGFTGTTASITFGPVNDSTSFAVTYTDGTCFTTDTMSVSITSTPEIPVASIYPDTVCGSGQANLSITNETGGVNYHWISSASASGPWNPIPGATTANFQTPLWTAILSDSIVYIRVVSSCGLNSDTSAIKQFVIANPQILSTTGASRCGTGSVTLNAAVGGISIPRWFTDSIGGTLLGTGANFVTPVINSTTNYWVEARSPYGTDQISSNGAPVVPSDATQNVGLQFNLYKSIVLNSFQVYSNSAGTVTVSLLDSLGNTLKVSNPLPVTAQGINIPQTLSFGWYIPAGSAYRLILTHTASLFRHGSAPFPYSLGNGVGEITSGVQITTTNTTNWYIYAINTTTGCVSQRLPVEATITTPPAISATASSNSVCAGSSVTLEAVSANPGYSFIWDGFPIGASQTFIPGATNDYTVLATDTSAGPSAGCANSATVNVVVNPLPASPIITQNPAIVCDGAPVTLTAASDQPVLVQVGTGTIGVSTPGVTPFTSSQEGSKIQYLFTKAELNLLGMTGGLLNQISWNVTTAVTTTPMYQYQIKMGHTSVNVLTAPQSGLTSVYSTASYTPSVGLNSFNFSTPFLWDGNSNLIVEVCHNNDPAGTCAAGLCVTASASAVQYTVTTFNSVYGQFGNHTDTNPWDLCSGVGTASIQTSTNRPNVRFAVGVAPSFEWSTGATTSAINVTPPSGSTTYTVTATSYFGCTSTNNLTTISAPIPTPIITPGDTALCFGTVIKLAVKDTGEFSSGYPVGTVVNWIGLVSGLTPEDSITSDNGTVYQAQVVLPGGCQATTSVRNITTRSVTTTPVITSPACGQNNGKIVTTVTGFAPYHYVWMQGATVVRDVTTNNPVDSIENLAPGTYTLEVTDIAPNGCTSGTLTYNLVSTPPVIASIMVANPISCNAGNNGTLTATHSGGTGSVTYLWSTASVSNTISNLIAGTYTVTITDAVGCSDEETFVLTEPASLSAVFTTTLPSCEGGSDGAISAVVNGGTTPYQTMEWYDAALNGPFASGATYSNIAAGDYVLYVQDANSCEAILNISLEDQIPTDITSFTPLSGPVGTTVTIYGHRFIAVSSVKFNGTAAITFSATSDTSLTAVVPAGATTGTITIITSCDTVTSIDSFTVTAPSLATLNLTAMLQGYYIGSSTMNAVLSNQGVSANLNECDTITVELRDPMSPSSTIYTAKGLMNTAGQASILFPGAAVGQSFYVVIHHRSSVQTWSALPLTIASTTAYNFTTAATQAFGDNQTQVEPGVWAIYAGDINQDTFLGVDDVTLVDDDNLAGVFGVYVATDVNGDGFLGVDDVTIVDNNNLSGIFAITP